MRSQKSKRITLETINPSSSKSWLIIGASGLLGKNLVSFLKSKNQNVLGTYNSHESNEESFFHLDLFNSPMESLEREQFRPDIIINTVALTNVDQCEEDEDLAKKLNIDSVKKCLEIQANFKNSVLLHISTDQIHDGKKGDFTEEDLASPINIYGKTKREGEEIALEASNTLVCRSNFYGPGSEWRTSFSDWIISNLKQKNKIPLFTDSVFNPLSVTQLSQIFFDLIEANATGLFHTCGNEYLSKFEFALKLSDYFDLDSELIIPTKLRDLNLKAPRPLNMTLNIEKLEHCLKRPAGHIIEGLQSIDFRSKD